MIFWSFFFWHWVGVLGMDGLGNCLLIAWDGIGMVVFRAM